MSRGVMRLDVDSAGGLAILTDNATVFANGHLIMREGDRVAPHATDIHLPYPPMVTGSASVFVEGKPVCGVGDLAACGDSATSGSPNVSVA